MSSKKLFCYVDETGQDTLGALFVVSVVIAAHDRAPIRQSLEAIERASRKRRRKWTHARPVARAAYIDEVLRRIAPQLTLAYDVYPNTTNYPAKTVLTVARSIFLVATDATKATVFVDGLRKSQYHWFGVELRHLGIKVDKVRGVRDEEADPLMRLADALCGLVRAALAGEAPYDALLAGAKAAGNIHPLNP